MFCQTFHTNVLLQKKCSASSGKGNLQSPVRHVCTCIASKVVTLLFQFRNLLISPGSALVHKIVLICCFYLWKCLYYKVCSYTCSLNPLFNDPFVNSVKYKIQCMFTCSLALKMPIKFKHRFVFLMKTSLILHLLLKQLFGHI